MTHRQLVANASEYFANLGIQEVFLNADAAIDVCSHAAEEGLVVARVEGGIWRDDKFMPRTACIWDGIDPPIQSSEARCNNRAAAEFIAAERQEHNAFIVTAAPVSGWPHRTKESP